MRQLAKAFTNFTELNDFIKKYEQQDVFNVVDVRLSVASGHGYLAERYVLIYTLSGAIQ